MAEAAAGACAHSRLLCQIQCVTKMALQLLPLEELRDKNGI